jgi:hypothetical protein
LVGKRSSSRPISGIATTMVIAETENTRAATYGSTPCSAKIDA